MRVAGRSHKENGPGATWERAEKWAPVGAPSSALALVSILGALLAVFVLPHLLAALLDDAAHMTLLARSKSEETSHGPD